MRWFIRFLFLASLIYIIYEVLAVGEENLLLWVRVFFQCCFLGIVIYTSTSHYRKYFVGITWTVMLFVVILKFIIAASFA
jgi:hypothetical protein